MTVSDNSIPTQDLASLVFTALQGFGVLCTREQLKKHIKNKFSSWDFSPEAIDNLYQGMLQLPDAPRNSIDEMMVFFESEPFWLSLSKNINTLSNAPLTHERSLPTDQVITIETVSEQEVSEQQFSEQDVVSETAMTNSISRIISLPPTPTNKLLCIRENQKADIELSLKKQPLLALTGPAGYGKTFLLRDWFLGCYTQQTYQHFIWISCTRGILEGFYESGVLQTSGLNIIPEKRQLREVVFALSKLENCLLVLDDVHATDEDELIEILQLPIAPGRITLVASANTDIPDFPKIMIEALSPEQSKTLFYEHYQLEQDDASVDQLNALLRYQTLGITVCSQFLQSMELSLSVFLESLNSNDLIDHKDENQNPISLLIHSTHFPKELMNTSLYFSFVSTAPIQSKNLLSWFGLDEQYFKKLQSFGFFHEIEYRKKRWVELHDLTSEAIRLLLADKTIEENHQISDEDIVRNITNTMSHPSVNKHNDDDLLLISHIEAYLIQASDAENEPIGRLYSWLGFLCHHHGHFSKAEKYYKKTIKNHQEILGPTHANTATSLNNLAGLYMRMKDYDAAAPLLEAALSVKKNTLTPNDPSTATCLDSLASLYLKQEKYDEALPLFEQALKIREESLGNNNIVTANSFNHLGSLYFKQRNYKKAESLLREGLDIKKSLCGDDHPETAHCQNNLASLYRAIGKYEEALVLYKKALDTRKSHFGLNHHDTINSLNNLADLYLSHGDFKDAERYFAEVLSLRESTLGLEHPETATSLNRLASLYLQEGLYEKAEPLYERAIKINDSAIDNEQQKTASSLNSLASLYLKKGIYEKAEKLYEKALNIRKETLGEAHPDNANSFNNLASLHLRQGAYDKAEPLLQRALRNNEEFYGSEHPEIAHALKASFFLSFFLSFLSC